MLGQKRIKAIADSILTRSAADQTEVVVLTGDTALTRFANSMIHQNVSEVDTEVRIRAVLGKRVGVATTNNLQQKALEETLDRALSIARLQPENPEFKSLPGPQAIAKVEAFSEATASCSPEQRAHAAGAVCLMSRDAGVIGSGLVSTSVFEVAVATSLGTSVYFATTRADISAVILSDTSAGYAAAHALDVNDLDYEAIGHEAVERCLRARNPRAIEPGEYTVILEPYAVQDFVSMMTWTGFSAVSLQEGRSFLAGKLGHQIMDARVSIWDDGLSAEGIPMPFDFEGVPKQRVDFVENGVARGVVYDSYYAGKEEGKASTGHALPAAAGMGPFPMNTFFGPGDSSVEEMISGTKRGIYVTRFHYTRPVEPKKVIVTGMTRDGTFLVENGEISYPVKNLRFTQSYTEALNQVAGIGRELRLLGGMGGLAHSSVPALKLNRFNFTGATEF